MPVATASSLIETPGCPSAAARAFAPSSGGQNPMWLQTLSGTATTMAAAVSRPPPSRTAVAPASSDSMRCTTWRSRMSEPAARAVDERLRAVDEHVADVRPALVDPEPALGQVAEHPDRRDPLGWTAAHRGRVRQQDLRRLDRHVDLAQPGRDRDVDRRQVARVARAARVGQASSEGRQRLLERIHGRRHRLAYVRPVAAVARRRPRRGSGGWASSPSPGHSARSRPRWRAARRARPTSRRTRR